MLTKYFTSIPYTKCILIEDTCVERGRGILLHILKNHTKIIDIPIHYFVFEDNFFRVKNQLASKNVSFHDFTTNVNNFSKEREIKEFTEAISAIKSQSILIIDSLVHLIYVYGLKETYRALNNIIHNSSILQTATTLHLDLLEDSENISKYFRHLSTLSIKFEAKGPIGKQSRLSYVYNKKGQGKTIREIVNYWFENDTLVTKPLEKPDVKKIIESSTSNVQPENLSTFKISLSVNDKKLRDQLTLPYLPEAKASSGESENKEKKEGEIIYNLDNVDDWDEEDPDDDLDI